MRKLLVSTVAVLGLSSAAFGNGGGYDMPQSPSIGSGSDIGFYLGLSGGYGMTHYKWWGDSVNKVDNDNGFVGRILLGYDISRYLAVEGGYTYFFNSPKVFSNVTTSGKVKNIMALDLMAKLKAPVVDNFDLYAKFGGSYLMSKKTDEAKTIVGGEASLKQFNVAFGFGADYYITPNIIGSFEWLRFNGSMKRDSNYQPSTDAFLVGLRYKFDI